MRGALAAAVVYRRWRPGDAADETVPRRRWLAPVVLGLAGCLATIALLLAVDALAHARVAEVVRWSPDFVALLGFFDEQAIVVIAVVCALIVAAPSSAAWRAPSRRRSEPADDSCNAVRDRGARVARGRGGGHRTGLLRRRPRW